ncbi:MAG: hypothetical protein ACLR8Y_10085 [Alistipes indistinctus]
MSARQSVRVEGATEIPLRLERCLARLDLSVSLGEECPPGLELHSIALRNVPATLAPFADNRPATENAAFGLRPAGDRGQQRARPHVLPAREPARHELGRHRTPVAGHGPCPRGSDVRPYPCELYGRSAELLHFLGGNTTDDFNLRRNRHYRME